MSPHIKTGHCSIRPTLLLAVLPIASLLSSNAFSQDTPPAPAATTPVTIQPTIVPDSAAAPPTPVAVPSLAATPAVHTSPTAAPDAKVPPVVPVPSLAGIPADTTPSDAPAQTPASTTTPAPAPPGAFTFGFTAGETRDQIIAAIGKDAVIKTDGDILEVKSAPVPNPAFDSFLLIVGPKQGLVKIIASGVDIDGDSEGKQLKAAFAQTRDAIKAAYGDPSDNFDFLKAGSNLKKPNQFMLALTNKERSLATYWTQRSFLNNITNIALEADGLGSDTGYLSLEIEFLPYRDYVLTRKP